MGKRKVREEDEDVKPRARGEGEEEANKTRLRNEEDDEEDELIDDEDEEWSDDDEEVDEYYEEDGDEEVEWEEGEEEDDAEYAKLREESNLTKGIKSISFAPGTDEGDEEDDKDEVAVYRTDLDGGDMENMQLEFSNKAYDSFFQLRTEYPCLSFDVVQDQETGNRSKYPLSLMLVCGSQADEVSKNHLVVLHIKNIQRTKHDEESDDDSEESYIGDEGDNSDSENEDEDDEAAEINNGEPIVNHRLIGHHGTANRVRCCPVKDSSLLAVWSDAGHVQVFDLESDIRMLADFANYSKEQAKAWKSTEVKKKSPLRFCTPSDAHSTEGYGLDWSLVRPGVFASGDCAGGLCVWEPSDDGRWRCGASNRDPGAPSVEEIQWSPTQGDVLVSTRVGGVVEVWDTRDMRSCKVQWSADPTDINVAAWNKVRQASHLLATGADSGAVAIWDLRKIQTKEPIQRLPWHRKSITSVEFSTHNESVLSVTADDGQCTLWDLSLERDPSEEQQVVGELFNRPDLTNIPDQLMFQHQGLVHPKEAHWHAQIPGMVVTTDYQGLNLFRPMNWRSLMK